ncbi:asparagine synthase-related protein [Streptomyces sp. NPDC049585]|uniref:asparagine synthase-related protein n=1 Tax=Streptomyces sp. NPDC049585 TaxID=3155154 RepID=UPI003433E2FF
MRWLVGWNRATAHHHADGTGEPRLHPVAARQLWDGPDPLWAVGDWRPDEIRTVHADPADPTTRLAVLGRCAAGDDALRAGLRAARGGALRHLTTWPGSYTVVVRTGRRLAVLGDLAGTRPVFHTDFHGGTAYATAALPLADLVEAQLDLGHLAALLACPDIPEALGDGTPYTGVRRLPPGHALVLRDGTRQITGYEPHPTLAAATPRADARQAVDAVREALLDAVHARLTGPGHPTGTRPATGADLSGGSASATLALLAAGLPGTDTGAPGPRLLAVTFNDLATEAARHRAPELERARALAADLRLHHLIVAAGNEALPYAHLDRGPLTDEPGPALAYAARHRHRLAAGGTDHLVGNGARQVLDAHPARLADLLMDRRRRHLLKPVSALARAENTATRTATHSLSVPFTVYRAARRLARTGHREGLETAAAHLLHAAGTPDAHGTTGPLDASLAALAWCRPGPAARWLTAEARADVAVRLHTAAVQPSAPPSGLPQRPGERRAATALHRHAADHRIHEQAVEARGQRLHAPFLDNQVVRACRALPDTLRVQPGARAAILRAVLAGAGVHDLPLGWGTPSHASHAAAARTGIAAALGPLLELLDAPLLADAGLVDAGAVRGALRAAARGDALPLDGLAEIVSTEAWLRRLLARRGTCWTGAETPGPRAVAGGFLPPR